MGRPVTVLLSAALIGLALAGIAFGLPVLGQGPPATPNPVATAAGGAMRIASSSADRAILRSGNLAPGDSVSGRVTISNEGKGRGALVLSPHNLVDHSGPGGSGLAEALDLTVLDLSGRSDAVVYTGSLAAMRSREVAVLHPGGRRLYSFVATLPDSVTDNGLQGAEVSLDYRWSLSGADEVEPCTYPLRGDSGANLIVGSSGGDRVSGFGGRDRLRGASGPDCLSGGAGRDLIFGEYGDDRIDARDGSADTVDCGHGHRDIATVDRFDTVKGCEIVR